MDPEERLILTEIRNLLRELVKAQQVQTEAAQAAANHAAVAARWQVDGVLEARRRNGEY